MYESNFPFVPLLMNSTTLKVKNENKLNSNLELIIKKLVFL